MKFYRCEHCGNIVVKIEDSKVPIVCCGEKMNELVPNTKEAAVEKHIPVIKEENGRRMIEVGSTLHPMTEEHLIEWIYIEYEYGGLLHYFTEKDEPIFEIKTDDNIVAVYEYCNLHGLWKMDN